MLVICIMHLNGKGHNPTLEGENRGDATSGDAAVHAEYARKNGNRTTNAEGKRPVQPRSSTSATKPDVNKQFKNTLVCKQRRGLAEAVNKR